MTTVINGTSTSASAPAVVGDDGDTGLYFPSANVLALATGGSERARVDSSGNIQIGQSVDTFPGAGNTVTGGGITGTGRISFSAAGVPVAYFNRNTDDGELVSFRRQGSGVGAINATTTGVTLTGTNGITFTATQTASGDANTLDDYEEGTWNPTDASGAGLSLSQSSAAFYRKIGSLVFVSLYVNYPSTSNGSNSYIGGLPFTSVNGYFYLSGRCGSLTGGIMRLQVDATTNSMRPYNGEATVTNAQLSGAYMIFSGCYIATS